MSRVMITRQFAEQFSREWVDAWNRHDLDAILSHYSDDFEMASPYIVQMAGEPSGVLQGKAAVRAYWATALRKLPDLHFELVETLVGVNSVTIYYRGVRGMVAEVFQFNAEGKVIKAAAHYAQFISHPE